MAPHTPHSGTPVIPSVIAHATYASNIIKVHWKARELAQLVECIKPAPSILKTLGFVPSAANQTWWCTLSHPQPQDIKEGIWGSRSDCQDGSVPSLMNWVLSLGRREQTPTSDPLSTTHTLCRQIHTHTHKHYTYIVYIYVYIACIYVICV